MIAQEAVVLTSGSTPGSLETVAQMVTKILRSQEPEDKLLAAIEDGGIPDKVGLELAEVFGEIVEVANLDNSVEIISSLSERGAISTQTEQILFLVIIEMATQEEVGQIQTGDEPVEVMPATVPVQVPELTSRAALIKTATELQQQFGTASAVPADKLDEIRQAVEKLPAEEFASLRQFLSSVILSQAELPADQRQVDVTASFEVVEILLRRKQAELTSAVFTAYEALHKQGFRLRDRDETNRPLVTITSTNLIRNRFRAWLDSHESNLGKEEFAAAENAVRTLERFLIAAAHESVQEAIQRDLSARLRERIIRSGIQALDILNSELIGVLPQTKGEAQRQIVGGKPRTEEEFLQPPVGYLDAQVTKLGSCLRTIGSKNLAEADGALKEILTSYSTCAFWRQEWATLAGSEYNPADQQPSLSPTAKRLAFFEIERKDLDQILTEIEEQIEQVTESRGSGAILKKLGVLRGIVLHKLTDLDQLINPLQPARLTRASTDRVSGIPLPPPPFSIKTLPPVPLVLALVKEASHG